MSQPKRKVKRSPRKNKTVLTLPSHSATARNRSFLKNLHVVASQGTPSKLANVIRQASADQVKALSELSYNFLRAQYPKKTRGYIKSLLPFKKTIRKLGNKSTPIKEKKKVLLYQNVQHGGLPFLAPLLAPIVGSLISAGISSAL